MKTRLPRFPPTVALLVSVMLVAGAFGLALHSSTLPQCCESDNYWNEAASILALDPADRLRLVHNYGYPTWLAGLSLVGLDSRAGVAIVQTAVLLSAILFMARTTEERKKEFRNWLLLLVGLPMAWSYSGYAVTEALVAPLAIIFLTLLWRLVQTGSKEGTIPLVVLIGVVSGVAWAVRPGMIWLPFLASLLVPLAERAGRPLSSGDEGHGGLHGILTLGIAGLFLVPQAIIAKALGASIASGVLRLELASLQRSHAPGFWRYATNLSGCGDLALIFSPHAATWNGALEAAGGLSVSDRLISSVMHIVAVLDPLPSPTYATHLGLNPFVVLTFVSAFVLVPTIWSLATQPWNSLFKNPTRSIMTLWAGIAALVIAAAVPTAAEFRFGVFAVVSMSSLTALSLSSGVGPSRRTWGISFVLISAGLLTLTYVTLQSSEAFRLCSV